MSETIAGLRRKIDGAKDLASVVRTMKALAASSIGQYETAIRSLNDYYRNVELGLIACLPRIPGSSDTHIETGSSTIGAVVFGSDQGLVGQFNDALTDHVAHTLNSLTGKKEVWAISQRIQSRLIDAGLHVVGVFNVPNSVSAITPLVGQIQIESEGRRAKGMYNQVYIFHNRPTSRAGYEPATQRLLPLDEQWRRDIFQTRWPSRNLPQAGPALCLTGERPHVLP